MAPCKRGFGRPSSSWELILPVLFSDPGTELGHSHFFQGDFVRYIIILASSKELKRLTLTVTTLAVATTIGQHLGLFEHCFRPHSLHRMIIPSACFFVNLSISVIFRRHGGRSESAQTDFRPGRVQGHTDARKGYPCSHAPGSDWYVLFYTQHTITVKMVYLC